MFDDYCKVECICPKCHRDHERWIEKRYANSKSAWRINGKFALLCNPCREVFTQKIER